jgi:hypothetical protein
MSEQTPEVRLHPSHQAVPRRLVEVDDVEALRLLGSVRLGRVVFTHDALPAIRLVSHVLDQGRLIFRADVGSTLSAISGTRGQGSVVAYEADSIDSGTRRGWSVAVVGRAVPFTDPESAGRYDTLCAPWVESAGGDLLYIQPSLISGHRFV